MQHIPEILEALKAKNFKLAVKQCRKALKSNNHPQIHLFLGIGLGELGHINEAKVVFNKLISHFPNSLEIKYNFALILEKNELSKQAILQYQACLALNPNNIPALKNLAFLQFQQRNFYAALNHINQLLGFNIQEASLLNLKGLIYIELKQANAALSCFDGALDLQPDYEDYLYNQATALAMAGKNSQLKVLLDKISTIETFEACLFCATLYEKINQPDMALQMIEKGLIRSSDNPDLLLLRAKIFRQQKSYAQALSILTDIKKTSDLFSQQQILYEKAQVLDKLKQYETAWQQASLANNSSHDSWKLTHPEPDPYTQICQSITTSVQDFQIPASQALNHHLDKDLAFIFGFTRSGTTLIDSILSAHTQVQVLEELPLIRDLVQQIPATSATHPYQNLFNLSAQQKIQLRQRYFEQIPHYVSVPESGLIMDKSPLNTNMVGFIGTLFPEAKMIFSVRHPLDVLVSCYFQQFEFNSYMTNMTSVSAIAKTYAATLTAWHASVEKLNFKVYYQHYEALIDDMPQHSRKLCDYLGLDWQVQMVDYASSLHSRAIITNPSYRQVNQPIYTTAKNRYKNYLVHLKDGIEILTPWIKHFGYTI